MMDHESGTILIPVRPDGKKKAPESGIPELFHIISEKINPRKSFKSFLQKSIGRPPLQ
jgi:hypothetical protein